MDSLQAVIEAAADSSGAWRRVWPLSRSCGQPTLKPLAVPPVAAKRLTLAARVD